MALALAACAQETPEPAEKSADTSAGTSAAPAGERFASPRDTAVGVIGGDTVLVDYGRPSRRGREIFGALVPWGQVWRTGANSATTLVLGGAAELGGTPVAAGTYTLYSLPTPEGWTLIVNGQTGQWGTEYAEARDVARIPMTVSRIEPVDTFRIEVAGGETEGQLTFAWDTLQGTVTLRAR